MNVCKKRGRPKAPFLSEPNAAPRPACGSSVFTPEFMEECLAAGEEVRKTFLEQVQPGVPLSLVLDLDNVEGSTRAQRMVILRKYRAALRKRKVDAAKGGHARHHGMRAADFVAAHRTFIESKLGEGRSISWVISSLRKRHPHLPGRSQMYAEIGKLRPPK